MSTNIRKFTRAMALAFPIIAAFGAPAMAGGGWAAGSQLCFSNCAGGYYGPSAPTPTGNQVSSTYNIVSGVSTGAGYHQGNTFGPQNTSGGTAGGASGWNNCQGCMRVRQPTSFGGARAVHISSFARR